MVVATEPAFNVEHGFEAQWVDIHQEKRGAKAVQLMLLSGLLMEIPLAISLFLLLIAVS